MALGRHKWLILFIPVVLAGLLAVNIFKDKSPFLAAGIMAFLILVGLLFATLDWPSHDEAAQAAMKDAWFWGTSIGIAIMGVGLVMLRGAQEAGVPMAFSSTNPIDYISLGVMGTLLCQLACYGVVWVSWWVSKR